MANRFWVGGNANWDATAGTKWATTSGGAGGAAAPTAADDVFLDNGAGTGNVTIPSATTVVCRSLNCTNYASILTFTAVTSVITIGDATAGASNVALKFVAGMTLTLTAVGVINLISTSATQQTIATGGLTMPTMTINGAGSSYITSDAINTAATVSTTLTTGALDFNGKAHVFGLFVSTGAATRSLVFNGALITCAGVGSVWSVSATLALTPDTGKITMTGSGSILGAATFAGGGLTYNDVVFNDIGVNAISGANTYANLTFTAGASTATEYTVANSQTITGTLTLNGTTVTQRGVLRSNTIGTKRTITAATVTSNGFFDLMDLTGAGAGTWSNTGWGVLNVASITGATPVTTYWVGGTGNSNDATKYSSTDGGSANTQRAPLFQDTAIYNANSGTGTLTINSYRVGNMNFTNSALTGIFIGGAFVRRFFAGDFILPPGVGLTYGGFADSVFFCTATTSTLTLAGSTLATHTWTINGIGTYNLASSLTCGVVLTLTLGTLNTNNYALTLDSFAMSGGTVNAGNETWTITNQAAGTVWTATGGTFNRGTSTILFTNSSANNQTMAGGGKTYYDILLTAGTGFHSFTGANTFHGITMAAYGAKTVRFTAGTTTTLEVNKFLRGTSGNVVTITGVTAAVWTITSPVIITTDYIALTNSTAAGVGNPFYAGKNSTNTSGNTNWLFTDTPFGNMLTVM